MFAVDGMRGNGALIFLGSLLVLAGARFGYVKDARTGLVVSLLGSAIAVSSALWAIWLPPPGAEPGLLLLLAVAGACLLLTVAWLFTGVPSSPRRPSDSTSRV